MCQLSFSPSKRHMIFYILPVSTSYILYFDIYQLFPSFSKKFLIYILLNFEVGGASCQKACEWSVSGDI